MEARGATVTAVDMAADVSREVSYEGAQLVPCEASGSDIRGVAGLPEQPADLRLMCPRCETRMELAAKDRARCPKCGLESVKVRAGSL